MCLRGKHKTLSSIPSTAGPETPSTAVRAPHKQAKQKSGESELRGEWGGSFWEQMREVRVQGVQWAKTLRDLDIASHVLEGK